MVLQQTYSAVKPDAFEHKDEIIVKIKEGGFNLVKGKELNLSREKMEEFYSEHKGKPFFEGLIDFMTSGSIYAMVLEKEDCILDFREFIGNTNPAKAAPGTIRAIYGGELPFNAIHASDSPESAEREINFIFE